MTKTPIAVALLMASSATPSLAHPFANHEEGYNRPVERTIERTVVRTTVAPAHQPAGHRHWRQSDWRRAHWHHNQGRRHDWQRSHWRRNAWRRQQWERANWQRANWNRHDHDDRHGTRVNNPDTNSCIEGSVIGGLVGAGLGRPVSGDGRWIMFVGGRGH